LIFLLPGAGAADITERNPMEKVSTDLFSNATRKTPSVYMEGSRFVVSGRSIPENPGAFYRPLYNWLTQRLPADSEPTVIEFGFEYLNTASAKWVYILLRDLIRAGRSFSLNWCYEKGDEDMLDLGIMLKNLLGCPFTSIEVDEINI